MDGGNDPGKVVRVTFVMQIAAMNKTMPGSIRACPPPPQFQPSGFEEKCLTRSEDGQRENHSPHPRPAPNPSFGVRSPGLIHGEFIHDLFSLMVQDWQKLQFEQCSGRRNPNCMTSLLFRIAVSFIIFIICTNSRKSVL